MYERLVDVLHGREDNYLLPFYWQHGDHREKIPEQIERICKSGCRALCVESRPHKDFCGPDWWADLDIIISECKARGMKVWILDDDHFPTGHANGTVKNHPELRKWMLYERHTDVCGPLDDALLITEDENEDHILLGAYIYPRAGKGEDCLPEARNVTEDIKNGFLRFSVPEGVYRVFFLYKSRRGAMNNDYIDMIRPESVRLLIDAVYEPHYKRYKEHFGKTIAGFFSDEPFFGNTWSGPHSADLGMYTHTVGMPGLALPYNDKIIRMMKDALGFDPLPYFPALWFGLGEKTGDVRHAYMDAATKLYRDSFTRQLGDWCEAHGVQYIGHIIEDMNAHARLGCSGGHYFRCLDGQHMSGIDIVLHQIIPGLSDHIHTASTFGNNADPEFFDYVLAKLASSFAHIGTQTENRAMCEVFGAYGWAEGTPCMKWLIDHLLVRGVNRFVPHAFSPQFPDPDCPPHFGADDKDPQFEGFAKLMDYTNKASHLLSSGVHRADAAILYHADAEWYNGVGGAMLTQVPAKMLYDNHIDFDILPADCFVRGSGSRIYPAMVADKTLFIGSERYKCFIVPAAKKLPEKLEAALTDMQKKGLTVIRMTDGMTENELLSAVDTCCERDIEVGGDLPYLRCFHCTDKDAEIYMFVNESVSKPVKTSVYLRSAKDIKRGAVLDILNDKKYAVDIKIGRLELDLAPYQSVIAVFDRGDEELAGFKSEKKLTKEKEADLIFKIETAPYTDMENYTAFAESAKAGNLPDIPADFSGRIRYTCKFEKPDGVCGIDLGFAGQTAHLYCNGVDLGVRICPPYNYDLSDVLREGENEMTIEVSNTLANALRDGFSAFLPIPASGIKGPVVWLKKVKN